MPDTLSMLYLLVLQLCQFYLFILVMRFAMHFARADFYNPLVQSIIKATDWLVAPLQKIIRPGRRIDPATLIAAVLFGAITTAIISKIVFAEQALSIPGLFLAGVLGAAYTLLQMYMLAIIALVIMSWIAPRPSHPAPLLIAQITYPIIAPLQRIIPPIGGMIDLSPLVAFFGITIAKIGINSITNLPIVKTIISNLIIVGLQ